MWNSGSVRLGSTSLLALVFIIGRPIGGVAFRCCFTTASSFIAKQERLLAVENLVYDALHQILDVITSMDVGPVDFVRETKSGYYFGYKPRPADYWAFVEARWMQNNFMNQYFVHRMPAVDFNAIRQFRRTKDGDAPKNQTDEPKGQTEKQETPKIGETSSSSAPDSVSNSKVPESPKMSGALNPEEPKDPNRTATSKVPLGSVPNVVVSGEIVNPSVTQDQKKSRQVPEQNQANLQVPYRNVGNRTGPMKNDDNLDTSGVMGNASKTNGQQVVGDNDGTPKSLAKPARKEKEVISKKVSPLPPPRSATPPYNAIPGGFPPSPTTPTGPTIQHTGNILPPQMLPPKKVPPRPKRAETPPINEVPGAFPPSPTEDKILTSRIEDRRNSRRGNSAGNVPKIEIQAPSPVSSTFQAKSGPSIGQKAPTVHKLEDMDTETVEKQIPLSEEDLKQKNQPQRIPILSTENITESKILNTSKLSGPSSGGVTTGLNRPTQKDPKSQKDQASKVPSLPNSNRPVIPGSTIKVANSADNKVGDLKKDTIQGDAGLNKPTQKEVQPQKIEPLKTIQTPVTQPKNASAGVEANKSQSPPKPNDRPSSSTQDATSKISEPIRTGQKDASVPPTQNTNPGPSKEEKTSRRVPILKDTPPASPTFPYLDVSGARRKNYSTASQLGKMPSVNVPKTVTGRPDQPLTTTFKISSTRRPKLVMPGGWDSPPPSPSLDSTKSNSNKTEKLSDDIKSDKTMQKEAPRSWSYTSWMPKIPDLSSIGRAVSDDGSIQKNSQSQKPAPAKPESKAQSHISDLSLKRENSAIRHNKAVELKNGAIQTSTSKTQPRVKASKDTNKSPPRLSLDQQPLSSAHNITPKVSTLIQTGTDTRIPPAINSTSNVSKAEDPSIRVPILKDTPPASPMFPYLDASRLDSTPLNQGRRDSTNPLNPLARVASKRSSARQSLRLAIPGGWDSPPPSPNNDATPNPDLRKEKPSDNIKSSNLAQKEVPQDKQKNSWLPKVPDLSNIKQTTQNGAAQKPGSTAQRATRSPASRPENSTLIFSSSTKGRASPRHPSMPGGWDSLPSTPNLDKIEQTSSKKPNIEAKTSQTQKSKLETSNNNFARTSSPKKEDSKPRVNSSAGNMQINLTTDKISTTKADVKIPLMKGDEKASSTKDSEPTKLLNQSRPKGLARRRKVPPALQLSSSATGPKLTPPGSINPDDSKSKLTPPGSANRTTSKTKLTPPGSANRAPSGSSSRDVSPLRSMPGGLPPSPTFSKPPSKALGTQTVRHTPFNDLKRRFGPPFDHVTRLSGMLIQPTAAQLKPESTSEERNASPTRRPVPRSQPASPKRGVESAASTPSTPGNFFDAQSGLPPSPSTPPRLDYINLSGEFLMSSIKPSLQSAERKLLSDDSAGSTDTKAENPAASIPRPKLTPLASTTRDVSPPRSMPGGLPPSPTFLEPALKALGSQTKGSVGQNAEGAGQNDQKVQPQPMLNATRVPDSIGEVIPNRNTGKDKTNSNNGNSNDKNPQKEQDSSWRNRFWSLGRRVKRSATANAEPKAATRATESEAKVEKSPKHSLLHLRRERQTKKRPGNVDPTAGKSRPKKRSLSAYFCSLQSRSVKKKDRKIPANPKPVRPPSRGPRVTSLRPYDTRVPAFSAASDGLADVDPETYEPRRIDFYYVHQAALRESGCQWRRGALSPPEAVPRRLKRSVSRRPGTDRTNSLNKDKIQPTKLLRSHRRKDRKASGIFDRKEKKKARFPIRQAANPRDETTAEPITHQNERVKEREKLSKKRQNVAKNVEADPKMSERRNADHEIDSPNQKTAHKSSFRRVGSIRGRVPSEFAESKVAPKAAAPVDVEPKKASWGSYFTSSSNASSTPAPVAEASTKDKVKKNKHVTFETNNDTKTTQNGTAETRKASAGSSWGSYFTRSTPADSAPATGTPATGGKADPTPAANNSAWGSYLMGWGTGGGGADKSREANIDAHNAELERQRKAQQEQLESELRNRQEKTEPVDQEYRPKTSYYNDTSVALFGGAPRNGPRIIGVTDPKDLDRDERMRLLKTLSYYMWLLRMAEIYNEVYTNCTIALHKMKRVWFKSPRKRARMKELWAQTRQYGRPIFNLAQRLDEIKRILLKDNNYLSLIWTDDVVGPKVKVKLCHRDSSSEEDEWSIEVRDRDYRI